MTEEKKTVEVLPLTQEIIENTIANEVPNKEQEFIDLVMNSGVVLECGGDYSKFKREHTKGADAPTLNISDEEV